MGNVNKLTERMNARFDEMNKAFDANVENLVASAEKDLEWLSTPFKPMDLQAGAQIPIHLKLHFSC